MSTLTRWLPLAIAAVGLTGIGYLNVQQAYRHAANEPQIQMAQDIAAALNAGATPDSQLPAPVDATSSLAPFVIITNAQKNVIASSEKPNTLPLPPDGSMRATENRFTWQPQGDMRFATVIDPYHDGYVIVARSIRESERNMETMTEMDAAGLLVVLALTYLAYWKYRA